jgi:RNA polymerase-binding transcription factor DksA
MATPRKSITRKSGTAARPARADAKGSGPARAKSAPARKSVTGGAPVRSALPARGKEPVRGKKMPPTPPPPAIKSVGAARPKAGKPAPPAAATKKGTKTNPVPEVRPLGVLPPAAIARGSARPAPLPPARPRPANPPPVAASTPSVGAQRVTEQDMKEFEQRLLVERQKILKEMGHLESTVLKVNQRDSAGDLSGYSFHMADVGTDAMEREKAFLFASAEGRTLIEINDALRRVYRGQYGVCESCSQPIARARLEAMPHARLCVRCKEKEERAQRGAG